MALGAGRAVARAARGAPALSAVGLPVGARLRLGLIACLVREAEQRRLFPWLAVAFGAGILACFTLAEGLPGPGPPLVVAAALAAGASALRARPVALALVLALLAAFLGFAAATLRLQRVAAPVLERLTLAHLTGLVEALDEREDGARLIVRVQALGDLAPGRRPERVRVSYRRTQAIRPGDVIAATARLLPPPEPARPGGYDFARDAFFRGIGAVGSLTGKIEVRPAPVATWRLRLAAGIDDARNVLTRRITDANGGQAGAVAAALVTGKRGLIGPETNEVLRAAGIYHVVSISGLHMVLAAGVVFWILRALLALAPGLALTWPIRKIAAAGAMVGVSAYCAFSGWDVAAERALIMTLVMLGAILVDRPAISLRNLALAALIALAREPEALLGPSFQMSFGAVAGLIASAPLLGRLVPRPEGASRAGRLLAQAGAAVAATLATTLVAQCATGPFGTYHFQTIQPFGLLGNALTLPLVSLAVMPAAVLGILAYPFALDMPVWWLMGQAVRGMLALSGWVAGLGHANVVVPAFGEGALALLALALLLLTLPASRLRWLALVPAALGLGFAATPDRFDVYVDRAGGGAAVRGADGRLAFLGRPGAFVAEQWLKADGDGRAASTALRASPARCDPLGCTLSMKRGKQVAWVKDSRAFPEDCARADVLITRLRAPQGCASGLVIDETVLAQKGAVAIRWSADGAEIVPARDRTRSAPWQAAAAAKVPAPEGASATPAAKHDAAEGGDGGPEESVAWPQ